MVEINDKETFKQEVGALLARIQDHISSSASYSDAYLKRPEMNLSSNLGALKIHQFRMKELVDWLDSMDNEQWVENKESLQKEYEIALKAEEKFTKP